MRDTSGHKRRRKARRRDELQTWNKTRRSWVKELQFVCDTAEGRKRMIFRLRSDGTPWYQLLRVDYVGDAEAFLEMRFGEFLNRPTDVPTVTDKEFEVAVEDFRVKYSGEWIVDTAASQA